MKKFALISIVALFVSGCQSKDDVVVSTSASAVVSASPVASSSQSVAPEVVPSASATASAVTADVAPAKK